MSDELITLNCPSCGGKLSISSNTTSLICTSCGSEHLVRRDANGIVLEGYARCPKCNRNDKVEKVSAIVEKEHHNLSGVTLEKRDYLDNGGYRHTSTAEVPFYGTQSTNLGQKLRPPKQPEPAQGPGCWWSLRFLLLFYVLVGVILGCGGIFIFISQQAQQVESWQRSQPIEYIAAGIGAILLICLYIFIEGKYRSKVKLARQETERRQREDYPRWQKAMQRWEQLYYCFRDGCVFIPGETTSADLDEMEHFIYMH